MNLTFLRGKVDERTQRVTSLDDHHDMWTHLVFSLLKNGEWAEVLYWGGQRFVEYNWHTMERWVKSFKNCQIGYSMDKRDGFNDFVPDTVICRGGFKENHAYLKRLPKGVFKCYYGAGRRFLPQKGFENYDLLLVDSEEQKAIAKKRFSHIPCEVFFKPAAPCFSPRNVRKKYDICFVAAIPEDERKRVKWVYETCPKGLKVLQLGFTPKRMKVPSNFTIKHVSRETMPRYISQCKVGIVPYTSDDSGPRIIPEMMASDVYPVIMKSVRHSYDWPVCDKSAFWDAVHSALSFNKGYLFPIAFYEKNYSLLHAARHLRSIIEKWRVYG